MTDTPGRPEQPGRHVRGHLSEDRSREDGPDRSDDDGAHADGTGAGPGAKRSLTDSMIIVLDRLRDAAASHDES